MWDASFLSYFERVSRMMVKAFVMEGKIDLSARRPSRTRYATRMARRPRLTRAARHRCGDGSLGIGEGGGTWHNRESRPSVRAPSAFAGVRLPPGLIVWAVRCR